MNKKMILSLNFLDDTKTGRGTTIDINGVDLALLSDVDVLALINTFKVGIEENGTIELHSNGKHAQSRTYDELYSIEVKFVDYEDGERERLEQTQQTETGGD